MTDIKLYVPVMEDNHGPYCWSYCFGYSCHGNWAMARPIKTLNHDFGTILWFVYIMYFHGYIITFFARECQSHLRLKKKTPWVKMIHCFKS